MLIETAALAVAARMSVSAVRRLVTQTNAAASEAEALAVVAGERDARADEIRSIASGFAARRRVGHRATMHIAALLRVRVDDLLEVPFEKRAETVARLRDLRDHLDRAFASAVTRWAPGDGPTHDTPRPAMPELSVQGGGRA